ncbi:head decoration protein [Streptomyces sp. TRM66268-LWL]|uniref:Head decoration protein n=1 Tax=Streptomyces polyasparticus TaxID=2767826 RepID=A0ABR7SQS3_9ACTN|nr:head decoration protein [Streptomyces polyasparticus]MBC9717847.1 head decoration protein [Streptomyces polyasparticus]
MDLQPTITHEHITADRPWLISRHGLNAALSITLDITHFRVGEHYTPGHETQPRSCFTSGIPLGRITTTGLYGPWDTDACDGREVFAGVLLAEIHFTPGSRRAAGSLHWHGVVAAAQLPCALDPTAVTQSTAQIHFV